MKTYFIDVSEEYPVYWLKEEPSLPNDTRIGLTDEDYESYKKARDEYLRWQDILGNADNGRWVTK